MPIPTSRVIEYRIIEEMSHSDLNDTVNDMMQNQSDDKEFWVSSKHPFVGGQPSRWYQLMVKLYGIRPRG